MKNADELDVFLVVISHSVNSNALNPRLSWIIVGVKNEMAAIRAVMGSNTKAQKNYDRITCKRLDPVTDSSIVAIFPIPKGT
jgi:hypothetical protein